MSEWENERETDTSNIIVNPNKNDFTGEKEMEDGRLKIVSVLFLKLWQDGI